MPLDLKNEPPYYTIDAAEPAGSKVGKIYACYLSQTGTDAPTQTILRNDYTTPVTWTRTNVGIYQGALTGFAPTATTYLIIDSLNNNAQQQYIASVNNNTVQITTRNAGTLADNILDSAKIMVWNMNP